MKLINKPDVKLVVSLLGGMSIAFIVISIMSWLHLTEKPIDELSTIIFFIMGLVYGAIVIFLCTYKGKTPSLKN